MSTTHHHHGTMTHSHLATEAMMHSDLGEHDCRTYEQHEYGGDLFAGNCAEGQHAWRNYGDGVECKWCDARPQRYHLLPSERDKPCSHPLVLMAYSGEIPCTGPIVCRMCGARVQD